MDTAEVYLSRAHDAATLAEAERDPAFRGMLLQIAETWLMIAEYAVDPTPERRPQEPRSFG